MGKEMIYRTGTHRDRISQRDSTQQTDHEMLSSSPFFLSFFLLLLRKQKIRSVVEPNLQPNHAVLSATEEILPKLSAKGVGPILLSSSVCQAAKKTLRLSKLFADKVMGSRHVQRNAQKNFLRLELISYR